MQTSHDVRKAPVELTQLIRTFRAHWIVIVIATLLGVLIAYGWTLIQPKIYSADATGTVTSSQVSTDASTSLMYENLAKSKVKSYMEWAKTRSVAEFAIDDLGLNTSAEALVGRITVDNPLDTPVIRVVATANTPEAARDLATAWLNGLAKEGERQAGITDDAPDTVAPVLVLRVTESASLPTSPTFPNVKLSLVVGLLAGLFVGIIYALLKSILDRRLRTAEQVEREFDVPVIGAVPVDRAFETVERLGETSAAEAMNVSRSQSALGEAMRELRTNLQYMNVDAPPRVMVVSSPLPGDGKSTITANLALAIAASGERVIVVDADLRRPTVAKTFGLVESVGLTDVLAGNAELTDVLQPWGSAGNLLVMGAGKHPPNPSELLGSKSMEKILSELGQAAIVLIDAPPLIPVTDSAILAAKTDGIILVASAGKTTTDAMSKALQNVERVGVKPLGIILNRMPLKGPNSAYYGYGYSYRTYSSNEEPAHSSRREHDTGRRAATRRSRPLVGNNG